MQCKGKVIELHRRLGGDRIAEGILGADNGGEEEGGGGDGVADETEDVDRGKVDGEAGGRFADPVRPRLWVEGGRPAEEASVEDG